MLGRRPSRGGSAGGGAVVVGARPQAKPVCLTGFTGAVKGVLCRVSLGDRLSWVAINKFSL